MKTPKGALAKWLREQSQHKGTNCLYWPFNKGSDGYGRVNWPDYKGPKITATRAMCIIAHGEPPTPQHEAAHSCGKGHKGCVNPNHLRWATKTQNEHDKRLHGTTNRGQKQWRSKLTEDDVLAIRKAAGCETQASIAERFGIDQSHVSDIVRRKRWAWLP
jgi:hypothetical protein